MSRRRDEMLDEMGLSPRWRLKETAAQTAPVPATARSSSIAAMEAASTGAPSVARSSTDAIAVPCGAVGTGVPTIPPVALETAAAIPATPATPAGESERIARVMQMDWATLADTVSGCTVCALSRTRRCTVFGVGDRRATWLFVGEGPGAEEDARGEPFVGQAGRLLDNMLAALKMNRGDDVYIANIVKCRPPDNRVPAAAEVAACEPYLHRQIELLQPKLIVALGKTAAVTLLRREQSIASMRGQVFRYRDTPLIVTYHPAYLLRSLAEKSKSWEDLCFARAKVREWTSDATSAPTA